MRTKGKVLGGSLIIIGTSIGAGMLALPLVVGELGLFMSVLLVFSCWVGSLISAFLILHVSMAYPEGSSLSTVARKNIGKFGSALTWTMVLMLLYSALAAYMTGGADLLKYALAKFLDFQTKPIFNALIFTAVFGSFIYCGTRSVDYANRILLGLKLSAFALVILVLFPHIDSRTFSSMSLRPTHWLSAVPILVMTFGYQTIIPSMRDYLHSNVKKLKKMIWIGGTIPLVIFLLWIVVIFGLIPDLTSKNTLSEMISKIETRVPSPFLGASINFFTDIAVTTSFLGVSLSLFHFVRDGFGLKKNRFKEKALATLITFFPPLCFAFFYPNGFILALSYGGLFVVILLMLIPMWMEYKLRKNKIKSVLPFRLHWTGLVLLCVLSALVLVAQFT